MTLSEALQICEGDVIAICGAGGKTSILYTLARENALGRGLYTTTTKMFDPRLENHPFQTIRLQWSSKDPPPTTKQKESCFLAGEIIKAQSPGGKDKVMGLSNKLLERWKSMESWPILIIEADGAAGKPVKYPSENEPVIPETVNHYIGCMSLEIMGREISDSLVHRSRLFAEKLPLQQDLKIIPETIGALINDPQGLFKNCPDKNGVKKTVILNKMDLLKQDFSLQSLIAYLEQECPSVNLICCSLKTGQMIVKDKEYKLEIESS